MEKFVEKHMVASLIQFKCTKYFRDDLTLVFKETSVKSSSKTSVYKSSRKYFVHLIWIRLATIPSWLDSSIGRAAV